MTDTKISAKYGLIGDNLDLKENISLEINEEGKIIKLDYDNPKEILDISPKNQCFLIVPGFINSHVHIADNFAKEIGFNKDLIEVVAPPNGIKHKLLNSTSKELKLRGIQKAALEMLSNGITSFIDFRERSIEGINLLIEALEHSPINYLVLGRFLSINDVESVFEQADGIGLASYNNISDTIKEKLNEYKIRFKKPIACHVAELKREGKLIKEMFDDNLVDIIIHGTQLIKNDLENIKKKKKSIVLCPRCNGYFGVGFPPITEILKLEIPISLGTDNLMANNVDLFEEMRYLYRISRVLGKNDKDIVLNAKDLLKMVTINAATNFNLSKGFGSISEGKFANFFTINLNDLNFFTDNLDINNLLPLLVQRTKSENIKKTYIRGELVFERL